jgi:hypothetical protein
MTYFSLFIVLGILFLKEILIFNYELIIIVAFILLIFIGKKTLQVDPNVLEPQLAVLLREPTQRILLIESETRKILEDLLASILVPMSIVDPFNDRTELAEELTLVEIGLDKLTKTELLENTLPQGLTGVLTLNGRKGNTTKRNFIFIREDLL